MIEHLPIMLGSSLAHNNPKEKHFFNNEQSYYAGSSSRWISATAGAPLEQRYG